MKTQLLTLFLLLGVLNASAQINRKNPENFPSEKPVLTDNIYSQTGGSSFKFTLNQLDSLVHNHGSNAVQIINDSTLVVGTDTIQVSGSIGDLHMANINLTLSSNRTHFLGGNQFGLWGRGSVNSNYTVPGTQYKYLEQQGTNWMGLGFPAVGYKLDDTTTHIDWFSGVGDFTALGRTKKTMFSIWESSTGSPRPAGGFFSYQYDSGRGNKTEVVSASTVSGDTSMIDIATGAVPGVLQSINIYTNVSGTEQGISLTTDALSFGILQGAVTKYYTLPMDTAAAGQFLAFDSNRDGYFTYTTDAVQQANITGTSLAVSVSNGNIIRVNNATSGDTLSFGAGVYDGQELTIVNRSGNSIVLESTSNVNGATYSVSMSANQLFYFRWSATEPEWLTGQ